MPDESTLSDRAVYQARPTVRIDGQPQESVTTLMQSMEMVETAGGLSSLELRLSNIKTDEDGNGTLAFDDDSVLALGKPITIYAGDENAPTEIFRGKITAIEAAYSETDAEFAVLAEDAFQQARMKRRSKVYDSFKLSDFLSQLASDLGLTPVISGLSEDLGVQVQMNESDLAFARRLLSRNDGDLQVVGTELHASSLSGVRRGEVTLQLHSQLSSLRVLADLAHQVSEVTVTGWDAAQGQTISSTSSAGSLTPGTGTTGDSLLAQKFSRRSEHFNGLAVATSTEAQAVADAVFRERARRFVTIEGVTEGNPMVRVGTHIAITGSGRFDNTYYVTEAIHRFDLAHSYRTEFRAECAHLGDS